MSVMKPKRRKTGAMRFVTQRRPGVGREYVSHLLRRSYREDGKVKKETIANLTHAERYRGRNVIERCFNRLKHWRRLATRYEKLGVNYVAVLLVVSSMHFLNLLI
jgi:hypothetical protein